MLSIDGTQEFFNRLFQINVKMNSYVWPTKFGLDNDRSMMTLLFLMFDKTLKYQNKRFYSLILCFFSYLSWKLEIQNQNKRDGVWWCSLAWSRPAERKRRLRLNLLMPLLGYRFAESNYQLIIRWSRIIFACFSNAEGFF